MQDLGNTGENHCTELIRKLTKVTLKGGSKLVFQGCVCEQEDTKWERLNKRGEFSEVSITRAHV